MSKGAFCGRSVSESLHPYRLTSTVVHLIATEYKHWKKLCTLIVKKNLDHSRHIPTHQHWLSLISFIDSYEIIHPCFNLIPTTQATRHINYSGPWKSQAYHFSKFVIAWTPIMAWNLRLVPWADHSLAEHLAFNEPCRYWQFAGFMK